MKNTQSILQSKIDRLIGILLNDGVQPNDLAENIYLQSYKEISYKKQGNYIVGELLLDEKISNKIVLTTFRYIYDYNKRLIRVEEEQLGKAIVQWDRQVIEDQLIDDITNILKSQYSETKALNFLNSLPEDIQKRLKHSYLNIA